MRSVRTGLVCLGTLSLLTTMLGGLVQAAPNDWGEGIADWNDGATRDFYNRGAHLAWEQQLGDWMDADGVRHGTAAYSSTTVEDTDTPRSIEWDATALVQEWVAGTVQNEGFFLHVISGGGPINFSSREHATASQRPVLEVVTGDGTQLLDPEADTYMEASTYQDMGNEEELRASEGNNMLLRFDLSGLSGAEFSTATLRLYTTEQYGTADIGVFRVSAGRAGSAPPLEQGLAAGQDYDEGVAAHADVMHFEDFEAASWEDSWSSLGGNTDVVDSDPDLGFEPLRGQALRVLMPSGENHALSLEYGFADKLGSEPTEIYFRYYVRLADDWNQTVDGGKMPGIAGTYGVAGWGGRPSDGTNGWSARGSFSETIPEGNPLGLYTPVGNYVYHADMEGSYGDVFIWNENWGAEGYGGILQRNHWYCLEQYLRMNTVGQHDGVLRAWVDGRLSFERTDFSYRTVESLLIEEIWLNVYHGGTDPSPYDQHLYIDNIVIAASYIGPMAPMPDPPDHVRPPADNQPDGNVIQGGATEDESGCGCVVPGGQSGTSAGWLLALTVLGARRRRPRQRRRR